MILICFLFGKFLNDNSVVKLFAYLMKLSINAVINAGINAVYKCSALFINARRWPVLFGGEPVSP